MPLACPAGSYTASTKLSAAEQCTPTTPGRYAIAGSERPLDCGAASFYCPTERLPAPLVVGAGNISTPRDGAAETRTGQDPCPEGHWCSAGQAIAYAHPNPLPQTPYSDRDPNCQP